MTGGSDDARAPHDERTSVDAAWDELIDESEGDEGAGRPDARPASGSHASAARRPDADDEMARLMGGETPKLPTLDPDESTRILLEQARAEPPPVAVREPAAAREKRGKEFVPPGRAATEAKSAASQPAAKEPQPPVQAGSKAAKDAKVGAREANEPTSKREEPVATARASRPSLRVVETAPSPSQPQQAVERGTRASRPSEPQQRVVERGTRASRPSEPQQRVVERGTRASRPSQPIVPIVATADPTALGGLRTPRPPEPDPELPAKGGGLPWAWIGLGVIALGVVAYVAAPDRTAPPAGREPVVATPAPVRTPPPEPAKLGPEPPTQPQPLHEASTGEAGSDDGGTETGDTGEPKPRTGDPREPPPGTPPEIAAVFRRLPVGPADRPPVGGIGASGIHVDHIAMGSETHGVTCRGRSNDFSVSAGDRAAVCIRVVHPREKEELQVLWQKHGGSTRRSKAVVLPMHAYRTRGYLVLRSEYIGDWTVRILSSDGVELARHDFTVVP